MAYQLEGSLVEVCTCNVLCPCWVGEDPDGGACDAVVAWQINQGTINGLDVSGLTLANLLHVPGNFLKGNVRAAIYVDDAASPQQQEALVNVWTGKLGGPLADVAQLFSEIVAVERASISFEVHQGKGRLTIGQVAAAELVPFQGPTGQPTVIQDTPTLPTGAPGLPAYVGKAPTFKMSAPNLGLNLDLQNHSAVQSGFRYVA